MEDYRGKDREKEEVYSKAVKAGKRTYFMDVKETKAGDLYLTITESKRIFDENLNKFIYDKHKPAKFRLKNRNSRAKAACRRMTWISKTSAIRISPHQKVLTRDLSETDKGWNGLNPEGCAIARIPVPACKDFA